MPATTLYARRGPLDKAVAMETEDQVGRGAAWRVERGGGTRGWVDFFITAAIIAPSNSAFPPSPPPPHYVLGRKGIFLF